MKLIFLDLDWVLWGYSEDRFEHDLDKLKEKMIKEHWKKFEVVDIYDIWAAYYDWNKKSVDLLKKLTQKTKAKIILSSDWRVSRTFEQLHPIFEIFWLWEELIDFTPSYIRNIKKNRADEIQTFLDKTKLDVEKFVILDDCDFWFTKKYPNEYVECDNLLNKELFGECR